MKKRETGITNFEPAVSVNRLIEEYLMKNPSKWHYSVDIRNNLHLTRTRLYRALQHLLKWGLVEYKRDYCSTKTYNGIGILWKIKTQTPPKHI